jgi:hypothetical protein
MMSLALASPIQASKAIEGRQLNGLLCPLFGTPLCSVQCNLVTGADGLCAPDRFVQNDGQQLRVNTIDNILDDAFAQMRRAQF